MKSNLLKLTLMILCFAPCQIFAENGPPQPLGPPGPPGSPIDQNLIFLALIALVLGYFYTKKNILNKKSSL